MLVLYNMSRGDPHDAVFRALANPHRRRLLDLLREEPRTTGDLCDRFPALDRCTVMQHLAALERAELVIVKREGRVRWNYLNAVPIQEVADRWLSRYAHDAARRLGELKRAIER